MSNIFDYHTGYVKISPKQGYAAPARDVKTKNQIKAICLNCTKPTCKGCGEKAFREKKKAAKNEIT